MSTGDGAIVSFDHVGVVISVDETFTKLFGFTSEEARGRTLHSLIFSTPYDCDFSAALASYPHQGFLWQRSHTTEVRDKSGNHFCASISVLVITDRVDPVFVLQIYKNREEKCSVTFTDDGGIIASSNSELVLQYTDRELTHLRMHDLIPNLDDLTKAEAISPFLINRTFNTEVLRKDGSLAPMNIAIDRIKIAGKPLTRAVFVKMDLNKEAVLLIDENENIYQCNASFVHELFGYEARELQGRNLSYMFPSLRLFDASSAKRKKISSKEWDSIPSASSCDIRHKEGNLLPVIWNVVPFKSPESSRESNLKLYIMRIARLVLHPPKPFHRGIVVGNYMVDMDSNIGSGTYGIVRIAKDLETEEEVAVKILDKNSMGEIEMERALREIDILAQLDHPNIVKLYDVVQDENKAYIFMEYIQGGSLKEYLEKNSLSLDEKKALFHQIADAIHHCHVRNIIHRDIKHANILVANGLVKLIDFGLSNYKRENGMLLATFCGSPAYAAPEMLQGTQYLGPEVDIWSLGVVFFSMITARLPFENLNQIISGSVAIPPELPPDCADLLTKMLDRDPEQRASLQDVLSHPCLASIHMQPCLSIPTQTVQSIPLEIRPIRLGSLRRKIGM